MHVNGRNINIYSRFYSYLIKEDCIRYQLIFAMHRFYSNFL